ncbi:MAG: hypothetical protein IJH55_09985 [Romboutsia sp.]|nr:hypothetical protein [Romboutsia sp.]
MREEEIKQLEIDKIHWRDLYWEECKKNKKLKEFLDITVQTKNEKIRNLIEEIEFYKKNMNIQCEKIVRFILFNYADVSNFIKYNIIISSSRFNYYTFIICCNMISRLI